MPKPTTITALAVINSSELKARDHHLQQLQETVVTQLGYMRGLRRQESLRGLFVGLALQRIKASMPHGHFGKWVKKNVAIFGERYVQFLMKLALVFIDKCNVKKPEILALPGDQTEFALDTLQGDERRFVEKAEKFTGELSLNELFIKYDIKSVGLKKELSAQKGKPEPLTPEQLYEQSRDEIGGAILRLENLLLTENRLQYLAGHPELPGVVESLETLAKKIRKAATPLLETTPNPKSKKRFTRISTNQNADPN
jgi:hypothetical protein